MENNNMIKEIQNFNTSYKKTRYIYHDLECFVKTHNSEYICALVGLRRTGKTTLMRQCAQYLKEQGKKVRFYTCVSPYNSDGVLVDKDLKASMKDIYKLLDDALKDKIDTVFIDEITYAEGFEESSNILADVYQKQGLNIVIAGTDSLEITFASKGPLYKRILLLQTTYIPYEEFHYLLPDKSIDDYILYGGTLHSESIYKNTEDISPFIDKQSAEEYLNTAIVSNILHALKYEEARENYPYLTELFEEKELISTIQKMINRYADQIIIDSIKAIRKEYTSAPLHTAISNVYSGKDQRVKKNEIKKSELLSDLDNEIREVLHIKKNNELSVDLKQEHIDSIKKFFWEIGFMRQIPCYKTLSSIKSVHDEDMEVITQPGIIYAHAMEAEKILSNDTDRWADKWEIEKPFDFIDRLDRQIKGVILEHAILLDSYLNLPKMNQITHKDGYYVSKLRVDKIWHDIPLNGLEVDILIKNNKNNKIYLAEVKYSEVPEKKHAKNLINQDFIGYIEETFDGKVSEKIVIYNGESCKVDDINYISASRYLTLLSRCSGDIENLFNNIKVDCLNNKTDSNSIESNNIDKITDIIKEPNSDTPKGSDYS